MNSLTSYTKLPELVRYLIPQPEYSGSCFHFDPFARLSTISQRNTIPTNNRTFFAMWNRLANKHSTHQPLLSFLNEPIHSLDKLISPSFIPNPDILKLFKCIDLLISSLHAIDTDCFLSLNLGGKCTLQSLATETMVILFFSKLTFGSRLQFY